MVNTILFWLSILVGYTANAVTGFAGNIFAMPVGIRTVGLQSSIATLNVTGVLACGWLAISLRKDIVWRELGKMSACMLVFMVVGMWLDTVVTGDALQLVLAVFIIIVGIRGLTNKGEARKLPGWILFIALACAGVIQGMFVCGGALVVIYARQVIPNKDQFRATLSAMWLVLNSTYMLYEASIGAYTPDVLVLCAGCVPILVVATIIGTAIFKRVSQEGFARLVNILLILIGAFMIAF